MLRYRICREMSRDMINGVRHHIPGSQALIATIETALSASYDGARVRSQRDDRME